MTGAQSSYNKATFSASKSLHVDAVLNEQCDWSCDIDLDLVVDLYPPDLSSSLVLSLFSVQQEAAERAAAAYKNAAKRDIRVTVDSENFLSAEM